MKEKIDSFKSMGKDSLVELALNHIKSRKLPFEISPHDYFTSVWENKNNLIVKFTRKIKFLKSTDDTNEYDINVNLITEEVFPFDDWYYKNNFRIYSDEETEKLDFIVLHFHNFTNSFENTILEKEEVFEIRLDNDVAFGHYNMDKKTGEIEIVMEGSYTPPPFPLEKDEETLKKIHF